MIGCADEMETEMNKKNFHGSTGPAGWDKNRYNFSRCKMLLVAVVFLATASLTDCSCKNRFLYYPYKQIVATPADEALAYEDVYFDTADGVHLNGWWVPTGKKRGTVLFCHGNGGNISFLLQTIHIYNSMKLDVFVFDYRGYGRSGGIPSEEGTYRDVEAAWAYLTGVKKIDPAQIIVIGRSLGGSIAAWLCANRTPRALVLESTFTKAADVANFHYRFAPGMLIFGDTYNTEAYCSRVRSPLLVVHSPDDEIIPYELGKKLFSSAPEPKYFLLIRGPHNTGFLQSVRQYISGIDNFLLKHR
jgi:uncharacterized protein